MKNRILALIDGFNYYHKLDKYQKRFNEPVKWINYRALLNTLLNAEEDDVVDARVVYFSAIADYLSKSSVEKHRTLISAFNLLNIECVLGRFKAKQVSKCGPAEKCAGCNCQIAGKLQRHEEKETDVNITIRLIEETILNKYDKCFLFSGDSDFSSVVKRVKELRADKKIIIVPPPPPFRDKFISPHKYKCRDLIAASRNPAFLINFERIKGSRIPDDFHGLKNPWK
jgi:uncharacterized LabA/DUF88 family protein